MPRCGSGTCRGRGQITRPRPRLSRHRPRPTQPRPSGRRRARPGRPRRWRPGRTGLAKQRPSATRAPRPAVGLPPRLLRLRPRPSRPGAAALQPRVPRARTRLGRGTEAPPAMRARAALGETRAAPGGRGIAHADASRADHRRFMITVSFQLPRLAGQARPPGGQRYPLSLAARHRYLVCCNDRLNPR
jgi:hypothetical protein